MRLIHNILHLGVGFEVISSEKKLKKAINLLLGGKIVKVSRFF